MCSDFRGDPHHKQFKPALTPDHNARTTMDTDSRDALKSWLGKEFPKDEGRFKRDTRQVFTCDAAPEESPTLLSVIGSASPHNQPQKSKIIYSVKGDKSGTCRVQNLENGHYEIVSTNLKYHGSMFEQPSGDAKESLQNRIGLKSLGNLSLSCQDVEAAWFQKGPERGQGTLCWIPRITVSIGLQGLLRHPQLVFTDRHCPILC